MTYFAIIMTGLFALTLGLLCGSVYAERKRHTLKHIKKPVIRTCEYLSEEYKNFLNYDGSEQA